MTFRFSALSRLFLSIKVIKNLSKVFMQQYNYPKLIWMKQNVSSACSNYRSNWQLIDNFCLHLSEPNRIETRKKRTVNWIVTIEPRCTVFSVNRFTSTRQHKETIQYLISVVQDLMLLKQPYIGPKSIIFEVILVISVVIPVISVSRRTVKNIL